ncbi:Gll4302 protein [Piscinibacter sakaiensis]|uniref:Gll4302 protein n=1 Tax=Piscinibacter sakaiensis TaxID=1547922 RepID=A0A0K8P7K7_PISS1|nr:Gll4302 protein [Piscinibacter sakaiensis]
MELVPRVTDRDGLTKSGWIVSASSRRVVGVVRNYKLRFIGFDEPSEAAALLAWQPPPGGAGPGLDYADFTLDPIAGGAVASGGWQSVVPAFDTSSGPMLYSNGSPDDTISFSGEMTDLAIRIYCHQWGGLASVHVDGQLVAEICTYAPRWGKTRYMELATDLAPGLHHVTLRPLGRAHAAARGQQVFIREFIATGPVGAFPGFERRTPAMAARALPHDHRLSEVIAGVPAQGLVLEVGGGDRFIDDPRYINTEYADDEYPGVLCDALRLPFAPDAFDAVVSQAVIEHVVDPLKMATELERVAKPGGVLWVGGAFMQPVHLEPWHYFNVTPYGMRQLFGHLGDFSMEWNGNLAFTVDWLIGSLPEPERFTALRAQVKEAMQQIESQVTNSELFDVASGVIIRGRKQS